ncbi:MAG: hypothetical protein JW384_02141 [Nitrosomonadaceae bacterium]|nr:hypothetical protein [Nitrosomonadaceae bacterium]
MRIHLEERLQESRVRLIAVPLAALILAFCLIGILLWLLGINPFVVYKEIVETSLTSKFGFGDTLAQATPLILTSLATAFAFKMKVLSIGAEGQLILGAIFAASTGIILNGQPALVLIPAVMAAGILGGAFWTIVPALLNAYLNVSVIITTLMLNFISYLLAAFLIFGSTSFLTKNISNFPQGQSISLEARLPGIGNQSVTWGLAISIAAAVTVWLILSYSRFGYSLRVCSDSPNASRYAGINRRFMIIAVLLVSGALAGLAGALEVSGRTYALDPFSLQLGLGYTGVVVAVISRLNSFAIIAVSILFGALITSGPALQSLSENNLPSEIVSVIIGMVLILVLVGDVFVRFKLKISPGPQSRLEADSKAT